MKRIANTQQDFFRFLLIAIFSLTIVSCSQNVCPTYQVPMERVKSMRSEEVNGSWERKSVPSPRSEKNKSEARKKYLVGNDTLIAAGSRVVLRSASRTRTGI